MPELPEVEVTKRALMPVLANSTIQKVTVQNGSLRHPLPDDFGKRLAGRWVQGIKRRGKYLLIDLKDYETLVVHLGMSGSFTITNPKMPLDKHDHVVFDLTNGQSVRFNDPRRFGCMDIANSFHLEDHQWLHHLGPEPLADDQFDGDRLYTNIKKRKRPIKQAIMDNELVVGVGNIYACESLFRAKIHPERPCNEMRKADCERLVNEIKDTLKEAIEAGGSTLKDFKHGEDKIGYFQHEFKVYDRKGEECKNRGCKTKIERVNISGRGTFFCPTCQK